MTTTREPKQPLDHLLGKKKTPTRTIWIAGDSELAAELTEMEEELRRLENPPPVRGVVIPAESSLLAERRDAIKAKRNELRKVSVKFVFKAIPRKAFEKLATDNPITKEQKEELEAAGVTDVPAWNPDSYPWLVIDACATEPDHNPGELAAYLQEHDDRFTEPEVQALFMEAIQVNMTRRRVDLGKD